MKYFIKATWWRQCHAMPQRSANLVVEESPEMWLNRQRNRLLGTDWTHILIDFCCEAGETAEVSPDPDFGKRAEPVQATSCLRTIGISLAVVAGLAVLALPVIVMDGLTHGGLFKNETWQFIRQLWV
jgi:hypothetical protein